MLILTLLFLGILTTVIGYYNSYQQCPPMKTKYIFLDRTIEEYQKHFNPDVYNTFRSMFTDGPVITQ